MRRVVCVLRSGGDFDREHVGRLYRQVCQYTSGKVWFTCLSDLKPWAPYVQQVPLPPKWWGKLTMFNHTNHVDTYVFFDLDTLILKPIDVLFDAVEEMGGFWMLESFRWIHVRKKCFRPEHRFASGVMAWKGDFSFIADDPMQMEEHGDQEVIAHALGCKANLIQTVLSVKSYKRDEDWMSAAVVCFHGKPRPWEEGL